MLAVRLHAQKDAGSRYFVGDGLTAADIYWTLLSVGIAQVPEGVCPASPPIQKIWDRLRADLGREVDPILIEHRDHVWATHLPTRLDA